jgi:hypothetical protein
MREPEGTELAVSSGAFTTIPRGGHPLSGKRLSDLSGRSSEWLKFKNPHAAAVHRLEEEDWGRWVGGVGLRSLGYRQYQERIRR